MADIRPDIAIKDLRTYGLPARKAFIDNDLQLEFEAIGYVVVPSFIDQHIMSILEETYIKFSPSVKTGFHVTNWIKDNAYSLESHKKICSLLSDRLSSILNSYKPVLGCFAVKEAGFENTMGLHQDWSLTDESSFCGISAWIPLVDVAEDSGALMMLNGSHRLFSNIRGQKIKNQLESISPDTIHRHLTSVPLKAGDLVLLHHRIVHCSGPASHRRIAAMLAMIPTEAPLKHYMADAGDPSGKQIKTYNCPDGFYVDFDIESQPGPEWETAGIKQTDLIVTEAMIVDYYNQ